MGGVSDADASQPAEQVIGLGETSHTIMAPSRTPTDAAAAIFRAVSTPLVIERFKIPALQSNEALVKIRCATICGSDLHSYHGRRHSPMPCILGHEMVGELVAMGPGGVCDFRGNPLRLGDRVTWSMVWSCGECYYCRLGIRPKCEQLRKFGHEKLTSESKHTLFGGMSEYCHLPARTAIFKVPENVADSVASPANCATATVAAVFRNAGSVKDQTVIVHGAGMLGQTACAMAAVGGAKHVVVIEPDAQRREQSLEFGATAALDGTRPTDELRNRVMQITNGRGADVAVELSGFPKAIELGLELLRYGGRFVLAGATFPARPVNLNAEQVVRRLLQIVGVYNYNPEDLDAGLQFLSQVQGRFPFERLVSKSFPLSEVNAAFEFAYEHRPPRVAVIP